MNVNKDLVIVKERLQEAMKKCKLSYGEISNITDIPKSAVHRYISGETPKIPLDRLEKIAKAMGVSAAWIMGWEDTPEKDKPDLLVKTLTDDEKEILHLFEAASPQIRSAALAVLKASVTNPFPKEQNDNKL